MLGAKCLFLMFKSKYVYLDITTKFMCARKYGARKTPTFFLFYSGNGQWMRKKLFFFYLFWNSNFQTIRLFSAASICTITCNKWNAFFLCEKNAKTNFWHIHSVCSEPNTHTHTQHAKEPKQNSNGRADHENVLNEQVNITMRSIGKVRELNQALRR